MKRMLFVVALLSLIFSGCKKGETVITGQFIGLLDGQTPLYTVPIAGTNYLGFSDTIKLDQTGKFELKLDISESAFVTIWNPESYKIYAKLLIEPGNGCHIQIDGENSVQISGANEKGQMLYMTLPNPVFVEMEFRDLYKETSLNLIHARIEILKKAELIDFEKLLNNKEISSSFFNLIQADRDCYYASLEAIVSNIKVYSQFIPGEKQYLSGDGENLLENLKKIYTQYSPNDQRLIVSSFWSEYTKFYMGFYQRFLQNEQKQKELMSSGALRDFVIDESKKHLTGKALEFFQAGYYYSASTESDYEKELISLLEQFEQSYPQSEYVKYLNPQIDKMAHYFQIVEQPFDQAMIFMDHYEQINSLEEAVKPLRGKKIYIDVWASWCGPCKKEFAYNADLKKMLVEKDIQQLYISIDRDQRDQYWQDAIKFYHLTGLHIRANKELSDDLMKRFDRNAQRPYVNIPWYILVDEKGNIIEEHAISPTQIVSGESLIKGS